MTNRKYKKLKFSKIMYKTCKIKEKLYYKKLKKVIDKRKSLTYNNHCTAKNSVL